MIKEFAQAWDANKLQLRNYLAGHDQVQYETYKDLVTILFDVVVNPYMKALSRSPYDTCKITEIDDGDYQGALLYVIPVETCQPSPWEYVITFQWYGSCSGCDELQGISNYEGGKPTNEQLDDYMQLCLHMLQHCKIPFSLDED